MTKKKNKPLEVDDASPCMKCGSVQCAFCRDDLALAFKGLRKDINNYVEDDDLMSPDEFLELLDKWFPSLNKNQKG